MSVAMLTLAAIEFAALIWLARQWFGQTSNLALLLGLTILFPIAFDAFSNGIGRFMGHGDALETLIRFRMTWYYFCMPFLVPIAVLLLGYAGFAWARNKAVILGVLAAAIATGVYQIIAYWDMALYPACIFDMKRYVLEVYPDQACRPDDVGRGDFALSPVVPIAAMVLLLTSFVLVWKTKFYWVTILFVLSNIASAIVVQLPHKGMMTFISYPFDGVLGFLICFTAMKLYQRIAGESYMLSPT